MRKPRLRFISGCIAIGLITGTFFSVVDRYGYLPFSSNEQSPAEFAEFPLPPDARRVRWDKGNLTFLTSAPRLDLIKFYSDRLVWWAQSQDEGGSVRFVLTKPDNNDWGSGERLIADLTIAEPLIGATHVTVRFMNTQYSTQP